MDLDDKITYNSRVYTDIQGLKSLQYDSHSPAAKKEVAQQFESMLMQMVVHSMREANKPFAAGLFGSDQMEMYQDLFDKQLTLSMSHSPTGLAATIEKFLDQQQKPTPPQALTDVHPVNTAQPVAHNTTAPVALPVTPQPQPQERAEQDKGIFASPEEFMKRLWPTAKAAASFIGASPEILLAQAALETNWGKSILSHVGAGSTHNLFNIKADSTWGSKTATVDSLEQKNGVLVKEKSSFRSYGSFTESFQDYIHLLKDNSRYSNAVEKAANPEQFVHALQSAGYATDQNYADKILKIFTSPSFKALVEKVKQTI